MNKKISKANPKIHAQETPRREGVVLYFLWNSNYDYNMLLKILPLKLLRYIATFKDPRQVTFSTRSPDKLLSSYIFTYKRSLSSNNPTQN